MAPRLLEQRTGVGEILAGETSLREASYEISVWVEDSAPADRRVTLSGHIDLQGISEAVVLAGAQQLTLRLEDGRLFPFELTGTGGSIVSRGTLRL